MVPIAEDILNFGCKTKMLQAGSNLKVLRGLAFRLLESSMEAAKGGKQSIVYPSVIPMYLNDQHGKASFKGRVVIHICDYQQLLNWT